MSELLSFLSVVIFPSILDLLFYRLHFPQDCQLSFSRHRITPNLDPSFLACSSRSSERVFGTPYYPLQGEKATEGQSYRGKRVNCAAFSSSPACILFLPPNRFGGLLQLIVGRLSARPSRLFSFILSGLLFLCLNGIDNSRSRSTLSCLGRPHSARKLSIGRRHLIIPKGRNQFGPATSILPGPLVTHPSHPTTILYTGISRIGSSQLPPLFLSPLHYSLKNWW